MQVATASSPIISHRRSLSQNGVKHWMLLDQDLAKNSFLSQQNRL
jgi:hypothetical protein